MGYLKNLLLSVLMMFSCVAMSHAGNDGDYSLSRIDCQTNLSHSAVLSVFQDNSGLIWFSTYDGLNSYDGREMIVYRSDFSKKTTLSNNVIHSVCQADGDCLWVNTYLNLNRFCHDSVQEIYDFGKEYSIHSNSGGNTFLICRDSLYYYNVFDRKFIGLDVRFCRSASSTDKRVFVTESGELWYFPEDSGRIKIYSVSSFSADSSSVRLLASSYDFHSKAVSELFYQDGTVCFVDSDNDLWMYDIDRRAKMYVRNVAELKAEYGDINGIVPFYEDIFIGFRINGLVKLLASDKYAAEEVDKNMRIYGLYKDSGQGILWVATDGKGAVMYAHKSSIATNLMLNQISGSLSRQVRSILTDRNGDLWFGTKGDGLVHVPSYRTALDDGYPVRAEVFSADRRFPAQEYVRSNQELQVYTLEHSRYRDGFWVGTGETGLMYYSLEKDCLETVRNESEFQIGEIHSIVEDSDSVLYIATSGNGFYRVDVTGGDENLVMKKVRRFSFYDKGREIEMFFPMTADGDSVLWLGSRGNGLVRFNRRTEEYQVLSLKDMLDRSVDDVLSLCVASDGRLYVGTASGLVAVWYDGDYLQASYVGREHGLPNDMIHGILEDTMDGFLWLSTNRGLVKYNVNDGKSHAYYYSGGVSVGEFSDDAYYCSAYSGELFFGGVDGLLWLNAETDFSPGVNRDIILRSMKIDRKTVNLADCYDYCRGERIIRMGGVGAISFSILYGVPDFLTSRDIEYSCILDGHDRDWSAFSVSNEATFSSVPPGKYVFRIRYKKDVFDTDYRGFSIPVWIVPPWYSSPWAIAVYVLLALAFLAAVSVALFRMGVFHMFIREHRGEKPAEDQRLADRLAVICHCCDSIRSDDLSYGERVKAVDLIKDTMSGILTDGLSDDGSMSMLPSEYVISGEGKIAEVFAEVVSVLGREGADVSRLSLDVQGGLVFPVYINAFRRILYSCLGWLLSGKGDVQVSAAVSGDSLAVSFVSDGASSVAAERLGRQYGAMARKLGISFSNDGDRLDVVFTRPADKERDDSSKNTIVLLGASSDLSWLISDILSSSYQVRATDSPDEAFRMASHASSSLFMVDMRLFEGRERDFLDQLYRNKAAVSKVSFLPMFTWNTEHSVCRELILVSDAYMMLPYDILMLKNVVHKAIFGKGDIVHVQVEDISILGGKLFCTNDEDAGFVRKVIGIIDVSLDNDQLGTLFLADRVAMSSSRFYRKAKKIFGISPETLIKNYRMEKAARLLKDESLSISDVIADVGIQSRSYFYKEFANRFGMTPGEYREKFCPNLSRRTVSD